MDPSRHIGIFLSSGRCTVAVLQSVSQKRGDSGLTAMVSPTPWESLRLGVNRPIAREGRSAGEMLLRRGLGASAVVAGDTVWLIPQVPSDPSRLVCLPGEPTPAERHTAPSISAAQLTDCGIDAHLLRRVLRDFLRGLIGRIEELRGGRLVPCESVTLCAGAGITMTLLDAWAVAAGEAFAAPARTIWPTTALAAWSVLLPDAELQLLQSALQVETPFGARRFSLTGSQLTIEAAEQHNASAEASARSTDDFIASVSIVGATSPAHHAGGAALLGFWAAKARVHRVSDRVRPRLVVISGGGDVHLPLIELPSRPGGGDLLAIAALKLPEASTDARVGNVQLAIAALCDRAAGPSIIARIGIDGASLQRNWTGRITVTGSYSPATGAGEITVAPSELPYRQDRTTDDESHVRSIRWHLSPDRGCTDMGHVATLPEAADPPLDVESVAALFHLLPRVSSPQWSLDTNASVVAPMHAPRCAVIGTTVRVQLVQFGSRGDPLIVKTRPRRAAMEMKTTPTRLRESVYLHEAIIHIPAAVRSGVVEWMVLPPVMPSKKRAKPRRAAATAVTATADAAAAADPTVVAEQDASPREIESDSEPLATGSIEVVPAGWGLAATLEWLGEPDRAIYPMPTGRAADRSKGSRPMATGVGADGFVALPLEGLLRLSNGSASDLEVLLEPHDGVRLWQRHVHLRPGATSDIPVQRRWSMNVMRMEACADVAVTYRVRPVKRDDGESCGHMDEMPEQIILISPPSATEPPATALPPKALVAWDLPTSVSAGRWILPTRILGYRASKVALMPADGSTPSDQVISAIIPGVGGAEAQSRSNASVDPRATNVREGDVVLLGSPVTLLQWFPGPMERLVGRLQIIHDTELGGIAVPFNFRACLSGVVAVPRQLRLTADAGEALEIPFDLLARLPQPSGAQPATARAQNAVDQIRARWRGDENAPPISVTCSLTADKRGPGSPLRCEAEPLPPAAVTANEALHHRLFLQIYFEHATGWESGLVAGIVELCNAKGVVLDQVPARIELQPRRPALSLHVKRDDGGKLRLEIDIANTNPFRALAIKDLQITARMKWSAIPLGEAAFVADASLDRSTLLEPGHSLIIRGELRPQSRALGNLMRRVARRAELVVTVEGCDAEDGAIALSCRECAVLDLD